MKGEPLDSKEGNDHNNDAFTSTYKKRIAIVYPYVIGGVKTATTKLVNGLRIEGFYVRQIQLHGNNLLTTLYSDISLLKELQRFDWVIYMGSIPWPSHIFITKNTLIGLFIHGFIRQELVHTIKSESLKARVGATLLLTNWNISKLINRINMFICHSLTSCENNEIHKNLVILPQFVLPDEIELFNKISESFKQQYQQRKIEILTYTSFAHSPRLLSVSYLLSLIKIVARNIRKEIELTIIDPRRKNESIERIGSLVVRNVGFLPRKAFLKKLINSHMFIEQCTDEELRYVSIEAGLIGTPVAKITWPNFIHRQDYTDNDLIIATNGKEFVRKLSEYLTAIDYYRPIYSRRIQDFISNKRTWNSVKSSLIDYLTKYSI